MSEKGKTWAQEALAQRPMWARRRCPSRRSASACSASASPTNGSTALCHAAFGNLVIPEAFIHKIGPAVNSGSSILLYGAPGNGKTSIAERIGGIFNDVVYIPYCFSPSRARSSRFMIPASMKGNPGHEGQQGIGMVRREEFDRRWVPCRRPFIVTGGELTMEMLDLSFNAQAKYYEAPLHIKALERHLRDRRLRPPDRQSPRRCSTAGSCRWRAGSSI